MCSMKLKDKNPQELITILNELTPKEIQNAIRLKKSFLNLTIDRIYLGDKEIGEISFSKQQQKRVLNIKPYSEIPYVLTYLDEKQEKTGIRNGYGIGTLVQAKKLLSIYKTQPWILYSMIHPCIPNTQRKQHLKAMEISSETPTPFPIYLIKTLTYAKKKGFDFTIPKQIEKIAKKYSQANLINDKSLA